MFTPVTYVRHFAAIGAVAIAIAGSAACNRGSTPVLNQQAEAHRLASHLHVQFARAADASNRAVLADTDDASKAAANESGQATQPGGPDARALGKILASLRD